MIWTIVAVAEAGGVRGIALAGCVGGLLWVEVETEPRPGQVGLGFYVRIRGRDYAASGTLDGAAKFAARRIDTLIEGQAAWLARPEALGREP